MQVTCHENGIAALGKAWIDLKHTSGSYPFRLLFCKEMGWSYNQTEE